MLEISRISKDYNGTTALDDLSLTVAAGETLCVLGPSGCGKSTLLKLISGLEAPDRGCIRLNGRQLAQGNSVMPPEKRGVNMVFQDYALWPHMKVRDIIGYGLYRLGRKERTGRVSELLERLRIDTLGDRFPSQISGGQQQRVAIARALATEPDLLLFDEPLSNLDVQLRQTMRHELADLLRQLDKTVLYVTHDPLEAAAFGDRLLVLKNGHLVQLGTASSLFEAPGSSWVATLAGYDNHLAGRILSWEPGGRCHVRVGQQTLLARSDNAALDPESATLGVTLMLPSDSLSLVEDDAPTPSDTNTFTARIQQSVNQGRSWRIRLIMEGSAIHLNTTRALPEGCNVRVRCSVRETLVFADGGL